MSKTYHFLAGLPRSGNTLLSALLNQNPDIYSSPLSPIPFYLWELHTSSINIEPNKRNLENNIRTNTLLSSIMNSFYGDVEKPIVIDRDKAWGTPANLNLIKQYITPTPKILFTVRDVLEILASFVNIWREDLINGTEQAGYYENSYRSQTDMLCEHLMRKGGDVDKALLSLATAFFPENKGMFHIIEYNDLISNPQETMDKVYNFLELPNYKHDFNQIIKIEKDNDEVLGLPKTMHDVKKHLSKSKTDISTLSNYVQHKYSNMEFWRENSLMKVRGKDF